MIDKVLLDKGEWHMGKKYMLYFRSYSHKPKYWKSVLFPMIIKWKL